jgi:hypothetical protein
MYNLQYDHDGRLMLVKIEEVCVFSRKALDEVIARLRTLRDKAWHDWHAERHDPRALEMVIRHGGLPGLHASGALGVEEAPHHPAQPARRPQRRRPSRLTVVAGGKRAS